MGDINIDTLNKQDTGYNSLGSFSNVYGLSNLVTTKTCFTKNISSSIAVLLTSRPRCFKKTFETGISDYHGLVISVMKSDLPRLKPKIIKYRSYKKFDGKNFLSDQDDPDQAYDNLVCTFKKLVDTHAPLKTKVLRGNSAPFMTCELRKRIYTRTRLKKRYNRNPTKENEVIFKKQRNTCVALRKKEIKQHFKKAREAGLVSNRVFWNLVKPFISNKGGLAGSDISLVKNNRIVTEDKVCLRVLFWAPFSLTSTILMYFYSSKSDSI